MEEERRQAGCFLFERPCGSSRKRHDSQQTKHTGLFQAPIFRRATRCVALVPVFIPACRPARTAPSFVRCQHLCAREGKHGDELAGHHAVL